MTAFTVVGVLVMVMMATYAQATTPTCPTNYQLNPSLCLCQHNSQPLFLEEPSCPENYQLSVKECICIDQEVGAPPPGLE